MRFWRQIENVANPGVLKKMKRTNEELGYRIGAAAAPEQISWEDIL